MKTIKNLTFLFLFAFLLSACGSDTSSDSETTTGENLTGTTQTQTGTQTGNSPSEMNSGNLTETPQTPADQSGNKNTTTASQKPTPQEVKQTPKVQLFPVELCNQIIELYKCIISKAPLENQPVMQENLNKSIQSRNLMADAQLREVCQEIQQNPEFQTVMQHYTWTGHAEPCKF